MRAHTPVAGLISRHTRDLLREYHRRGMIDSPIATRIVVDTTEGTYVERAKD